MEMLKVLLLVFLVTLVEGRSYLESISLEEFELERQQKSCNCGAIAPLARITPDGAVKLGEIPWQVSIQRKVDDKYEHFCGGTIIHKDFILTAAHCFQNNTNQDFRVVAGEIKWNTTKNYKIKKITRHEQFDVLTLGNDICLIQLDASLPYNDVIRPVCLPNTPMLTEGFTGQTATASGWGVLTAELRDKLNKADLKVISSSICSRLFTLFPVTASFICTASRPSSIDIYDFGGPLTVKKGLHSYLLGVIILGIPEGRVSGIYASVPSYMDWIQKTTNTTICTN